MTKADIVNDLYERLGYSKRECANIVDSVFDIIKETLSKGENVKISGFGNFVLKDKKERKGRNPKTGEEMVIPRRRVLNFKLSQVLKETMNQR
ncbi:MAG: integration host factor subunit alpha [Desulfobacterota bacterium]|nr:integration host factor subunit alpha [Thermodesulfobacteriota bacterium]MDW8001999.1 integration host factor subunit alpha [Deltaproteobacteria bacterium]